MVESHSVPLLSGLDAAKWQRTADKIHRHAKKTNRANGRAIVHIGLPRTGTTTLQKLFNNHRDDLLREGILYPDLTPGTSTYRHINHQHLGETFDGRRSRSDRSELLDLLDKKLADTSADIVVLSYERLCFLSTWSAAPRILRDLFERRGYALELLLTVRSQAGAVQSNYAWRCQFLREHRIFREAFDNDLAKLKLDPAVALRPWLRSADGRASAVPLRDAVSRSPLVDRVACALDIQGRVRSMFSDAEHSLVENNTLDSTTIEISRRLRESGIVLKDNATARRVVDAIEREVQLRELGTSKFRGLSPEMIKLSEQRFASRNDRFANRMWGVDWSHRVAADQAHENTGMAHQVGELPGTIEAQIIEIMSTICAEFSLQSRPWWRKLAA